MEPRPLYADGSDEGEYKDLVAVWIPMRGERIIEYLREEDDKPTLRALERLAKRATAILN